MTLEISAPDLIDPLVGFRRWRLAGHRLCSPLVPLTWSRPVMEAKCYWSPLLADQGRLEGAHPSPHPECKCGIYVDYRPRRKSWAAEMVSVLGIVTAWGRIELHAGGMRVQHARVEALALSPRWGLRRRRALERVAAQLGADVVDYSNLEEAAEKYGHPPPASLIPDASAGAWGDRGAAARVGVAAELLEV